MSNSSTLRDSRASRRSQSARSRRYRHALRQMETLEPRTLMSATATLISDPNLAPSHVAYDSADNLWVVNYGALSRIVNGAVAESHAMPETVIPINLVNGNDGNLYITDVFGSVTSFNLATDVFTTYTFEVGEFQELINSTRATVTNDGGLWYVGQGNSMDYPNVQSYIVRFDTTTHEVEYTIINDFDPTVADATAFYITPRDDNSVWVGMQGNRSQALSPETNEPEWVTGRTRIASVGFDGQDVLTEGVYSVNTGDAYADEWGVITGVAADTDGTLWISLGNFPVSGTIPPSPSDRLLNLSLNSETNLLQLEATVLLSGSEAPVGASELLMDSAGRLWFQEIAGTNLGYFDTLTGVVTHIAYPAGVEIPTFMAVSPSADELTMLTVDQTAVDGSPFVVVTFDEPTVTFSGSAFAQAGVEGVAIEGILLATFTAPAPAGAYSVLVTWGDGTTTTVTPVSLGENTYGVIVSSKTFAGQGTFNGTVSVLDGVTEAGALGFVSTVSDVPLEVTSLAVTNPNGKFADLFLTFTDDLGGSASWYLATIQWGDGVTTTGIVVKDAATPGKYFVIGNHKYKRKGLFTVKATITTSEVDAAVITASQTVNVTI